MKPKVIVTSKIYDEVLQILNKDCEVVIFEQIDEYSYPHFLENLSDSVGVLCLGVKIDKEVLTHAPRLKIVSNVGAGFDNLALDEMTARKIMGTNTPDIVTDTTADAVMGLILATARRIPEMDQYVRTGKWKALVEDEFFGVDVYGKTLGIIGMGRIGQAIAKRAHRGFDMNILYHNRSRNDEAEQLYSSVYCSLEELLQRSDYVCLMTPLTKETEHLMTIREFKLMKENAIFINASRGKTVNEKDLIFALKKRWIAAAGLDVFEKEPIDLDNPLIKFPNVVTLPHIGGATTDTRMKMQKLAVSNLIQGLSGRTPQNLINADVL